MTTVSHTVGPEFDPRSPYEEHMIDGGLAQLEERVVRNDEAPGSKPGFSIYNIYIYVYKMCAPMAQLAERLTVNQ